MFGKVSRGIFLMAMLVPVAGCMQSGPTPFDRGTVTPGKIQPNTPTTSLGASAPVIEGSCPQINLREQTAFYRSYANGGQDDPEKVIFQASIVDTTRNCTMNESALTINVVAQGRLVMGPAGTAGKVVLPVSIRVVDGETELYSSVTPFEVDLPPGSSSTQFLFNKSDVSIPGGAGKLAKVFIGFDQAPAKKKKK